MDIITSNQNLLIKEIKGLELRKNREEKGLFIAEGLRFVEESVKEKALIDKIVVSNTFLEGKSAMDIMDRIRNMGLPCYVVSDKIFKEISDTQTPQGILAVIKKKDALIGDIIKSSNKIVMLESLQDPGNMGTIIRTADAAGMTGIILSKGCVDVYNRKVLRSTMGSIFHLPIHRTDDFIGTIKELKAKGIKVYASHLEGSINYYDIDECQNTAVIIGNEANGISDEAAMAADCLIKIPMPGKAESLNASVAAGILMYEILRKSTTTPPVV
ncbi:MAG TPA: 23S rRNA (guanosine(2251)-2'-O)-methyltransferase RlmB [Pseudobacteroides sp.]|nr:23S rRNA (guanosine(2251)-2'-O)-methyltransferase RlmB [Pseudobacteroides sp.]